jgi:DNA phosphorothioation-dependent restriction protein DptG
MTEYLVAARAAIILWTNLAAIILWTNLAVMPAEILFDAIEAELERRGVGL